MPNYRLNDDKNKENNPFDMLRRSIEDFCQINPEGSVIEHKGSKFIVTKCKTGEKGGIEVVDSKGGFASIDYVKANGDNVRIETINFEKGEWADFIKKRIPFTPSINGVKKIKDPFEESLKIFDQPDGIINSTKIPIETIDDITEFRKDLNLMSDALDVAYLNSALGLRGDKRFQGFFVKIKGGEYKEIYGFKGRSHDSNKEIKKLK